MMEEQTKMIFEFIAKNGSIVVNDASGVVCGQRKGMIKRSEEKGSVDSKGICLRESFVIPNLQRNEEVQ